MLETRTIGGKVDAILYGAASAAGGKGTAARVLVNPAVCPGAGDVFFRSGPSIVYGTKQTAPPAGKTLAVYVRKEAWPLREVLGHLAATHGVRRVACGEDGNLFRALAADGLLDELTLAWCPRMTGCKSAEPITGKDEAFLPRGIRLDLAGLEHRDDECVARYRVQGEGR